MASFVLRDPVLLAYQWASLDQIAHGRTVLIACTGIIEQAGGKVEARVYGVENRDRVRRLIEWIEILELLWTQEDASYAGRAVPLRAHLGGTTPGRAAPAADLDRQQRQG